jgi:hypothetical protein
LSINYGSGLWNIEDEAEAENDRERERKRHHGDSWMCTPEEGGDDEEERTSTQTE